MCGIEMVGLFGGGIKQVSVLNGEFALAGPCFGSMTPLRRHNSICQHIMEPLISFSCQDRNQENDIERY
jgi:hypothetical protein